MNTINFSETQRFKVWWVWGILLAINLLFIYAIVQQLIAGKPFGTKPAPHAVLILVESVMLILFIFFIALKLTTRINTEGIYYRFYPFHFKEKFIAWNSLSDAYMREYNSFYEYGGWGIRYGSPKTGQAINTTTSCNKGLQLQFANGRRLLIGTQKPDELESVIKQVWASGYIIRPV